MIKIHTHDKMEGEPSSLIAAAANPTTPSSLIVKYLHAIPRFNLTFHRVSNHFNPDSSTYAEVSNLCMSIRMYNLKICGGRV